ncbi:uncharacterized protein Bfra_006613 [Botrytis fragariae]|uniref:Uncharacterized protein n=1 Tax=Botrytis fragariae TaxID=1964551 RepID=A0A8H6EP91_9HELO|nr:uncharacterized protein Bfra_006613 [Botrytis fragariae]KAF5879404.1 hypothetical protein Bfra_006613 [Botrytis fragariae]
MANYKGSKSNANSRNRATRRADRVSDIPVHDMVQYAPSNAALSIGLDFFTTRLPGEEQDEFECLLEIIPRYGNDTNIIHLKMMFQAPEEDIQGIYRCDILAQVVEQINNLPHIKEISFVLAVDRFNWKQIDTASSIYRLKFIDWTFELNIKDKKAQKILAGSQVDRQLRAVERKLHQ